MERTHSAATSRPKHVVGAACGAEIGEPSHVPPTSPCGSFGRVDAEGPRPPQALACVLAKWFVIGALCAMCSGCPVTYFLVAARPARPLRMSSTLRALNDALRAARSDTGLREGFFSPEQLASQGPPPGITGWQGPYLDRVPTNEWGDRYLYDPALSTYVGDPSPAELEARAEWVPLAFLAVSVVTVGVVFAGVAGRRTVRGRRGQRTECEAFVAAALEVINGALHQARQDTKSEGRFLSLSELANTDPPPGVTGWSGPYLKGVPEHPLAGRYLYDPVDGRYASD